MATYTYSEQVQRVMAAEGLVEDDLERMLKHAAITGIRGASRRFHHWFFRMEGQHIRRMFIHTPDNDRVDEWEDCNACEGVGCSLCGYSGQMPCN